MADAKISALPAATTPLVGTEAIPVVQGGVTDQATAAQVARTLAPPFCRMRTATVPSVPGTYTFTRISNWDTVITDSDSMSSAAASGRLTFNTAGIYSVMGNVSMQISGNKVGDIASLRLRLNGSTNIAGDDDGFSIEFPTTSIATLSVATIRHFNAADYIEMTIAQETSSSISPTVNNEWSPLICACWLGNP